MNNMKITNAKRFIVDISSSIILVRNKILNWIAPGGRVSDVAREVVLPKVSDNVCGNYWGVSTYSRLCAGYNLAHKGICPVRTLAAFFRELGGCE